MRYTMTVTKNTLPEPASYLVKTPYCPEGYAPYPKRWRVSLWADTFVPKVPGAVTGSGDGDTMLEAYRKAMAALWWQYDRYRPERPAEVVLYASEWREFDSTGDTRTIRRHRYE